MRSAVDVAFSIRRCPALAIVAAFLVGVGGCNGGAPGAPASGAPAATEPRPRFGAVMNEVGQRFERAGRAASAGRFELAAFEIDELNELFAEDLARAELPKEGPSASLPAMAASFAKTYPGRLKAAAVAHDLEHFRTAFREASVSCNACHASSGHAFIEIPGTIDKPVPNLDPLPADAAP